MYTKVRSILSQIGDVEASNASDSYKLCRRTRSSPPRLNDIPSRYFTDNDKMEGNHIDTAIVPVNLSSNSVSGNEGIINMAAVSAERCKDWVHDSRACVKNELTNGNHYSAKDSGDDERKNKSMRNKEKCSTVSTGPSSGDVSHSTAASCGSNPLSLGGWDYSKNSSDTESMSPDNEPLPSCTSHCDNGENVQEQHKRVHYEDHKLSEKHIKQHQKHKRRHRQSSKKLAQGNTTLFQKPHQSKKSI